VRGGGAPLVLLLPGILLIGCGEGGGGVEGESQARPSFPLVPGEVVGPGRVEPEGGILALSTEVGGRVVEVLVQAGDVVDEGAPLVRLDARLEDSRLRQAEVEVTVAEARVTAARSTAEVRRPPAEQAEREEARVASLYAAGVTSVESLERVVAVHAEATAALAEAVALVGLEEAGVLRARAVVEVAKTELLRREIRAPVAGVVLSVGVRLGEVLTGFQPGVLVELAPFGGTRVMAEVDELFAGLVGPGQRVRVRDPGGGVVLAEGEVVFAAPLLSRKSLFTEGGGEFEDRRVREVHVRLPDPGGLLPGTRVEVTILVEDGTS